MQKKELLALQSMVRDLLNYTINQGLPFSDEFQGQGFKEHLRLARNAESTLLVIHFHIGELTYQVSRLDLESSKAFREWIYRVKGPCSGSLRVGFLDLTDYYL